MNAESIFIKKHDVLDSCSFESLKKEGITTSQKFSGHVWTDYNIHDPGVTILEQLCFVLSDVAYRIDYPVVDYLTDSSSDFCLAESSLIPPEQIFPCHATTQGDLKKVILDQVLELDNVHIEKLPIQNYRSGLSNIYISISPLAKIGNSELQESEVKRRVLSCFAGNRNLCENIDKVYVTKDITYTLQADIDIENINDSTEVLAKIYFNCAQIIAQKPQSFETNSTTNALSKFLTGPSVEHEHYDFEVTHKKTIPSFEFHAVINNIKGVKNVNSLGFIDSNGQLADILQIDSFKQHIRIFVPDCLEQISVLLKFNGRESVIDFESFKIKYQELITEFFAKKTQKISFDTLYSKPVNHDLHIKQYTGIQNHFPPNYGINYRGVPRSLGDKRKAQAFQLKGYLAIFEQIILNQINKIDEIKYLFSPLLFVNSQPSSAFLDSNIIPDFEQIKSTKYEEQLVIKDQRFCSFYRRASKILDYLLALYGEKFNQHSLKQFNYYISENNIEKNIVQNKIRLLSHIVDVTKNRLKATNLKEQVWNTNNVSGLQLKASILLDFGCLEVRSLSFGVYRNDINVSFKQIVDSSLPESFFDFFIDKKIINEFFQPIDVQSIETVTLKELNECFPGKFTCKENAVSQQFLKAVTNIRHFKVGEITKQSVFEKNDHIRLNQFYLSYFDQHESSDFAIGEFDDKTSAIYAANVLVSYFQNISCQSEGMHIVEHNLISQYFDVEEHKTTIPPSFFQSRISVVMPNWTGRTSDKQFQKFAEETVLLNCPAHLYPMFLWLDLKQMYLFEVRFKKWLQVSKLSDKANLQLAKTSHELANYLFSLHGSMKGAT
jgi:hypothetical protein